MEIIILLFYKFINISNTTQTKNILLDLCKELGVLGKIIIAKEGINGSISGTKSQTNKFKLELMKNPKFKDIEFKEETDFHHPFNILSIKIKKEIIRLDKKININNKGNYISPKEFFNLYKNNEDVIILDTRNEYESKVGRFKNAVLSKIDSFREFPNFVKNLDIPKNKKIAMYCTGGIRCEKASAYMTEQGFSNVIQLNGGIIKYCQEFPNTVWEGSCFVFDKRLTSNIGQKEVIINNCIHCKVPCNFYDNCKNILCNDLIFICPKCEKSTHKCCSDDCMKKLLSSKK